MAVAQYSFAFWSVVTELSFESGLVRVIYFAKPIFLSVFERPNEYLPVLVFYLCLTIEYAVLPNATDLDFSIYKRIYSTAVPKIVVPLPLIDFSRLRVVIYAVAALGPELKTAVVGIPIGKSVGATG